MRRQAGAARLAPDARTELLVAVDRSASLLPAQRAGAVQALLEVLLGVSAVWGSADSLPVWELGAVPRPLPQPLDRANAPGFVTHVLGERITTDGTLLAPLVRATAGVGGSRTVVVVTDGVPADLEEVTAALRETTRARGTTRWHLLAIARGTDDATVRHEPWRDELTALAPLVAERLLTVSSVAPGTGPAWLSTRLTEASALDALVAGLPLLPLP